MGNAGTELSYYFMFRLEIGQDIGAYNFPMLW